MVLMTNTKIGASGSTMVAAAAGVVLAMSAYLVLAGAPREDHEPDLDDADPFA